MGKLEIGDKVRIPKYNAYGTITDIDENWIYPYEVRIETIYGKEVEEHDEIDELYEERDLYKVIEKVKPIELYEKEKEKVVTLDGKNVSEVMDGIVGRVTVVGNVVLELTIQEEIERLIKRIKENPFGQSRQTSLAITKLDESRLWLNEHYRVMAKGLTETE